MHDQGNYPPFMPPPFQQTRPNHLPPPPFQQAPPPAPQPPTLPLNPPLPPPSQYQYGVPPPQQPGPSYMHLSLPPPPPVQGNSLMPPPYSQPNTSYPSHNFSQPIPPPPRMLSLPPPPPPPYSQGQVLFRIPPPPPLGLQHVPAPSPLAPLPSSFISITPSPFPPTAPPPSPPPPPSSPPPLPPSPPPLTSPTTEISAFQRTLYSDTAKLVADSSVAPNDSDVGKSENNSPVVTTRAFEDLPPSVPKPADEKDSHQYEEQNVPSQSVLKEEGSSQSGIFDDEGGAISPTASDMDMEDDVSQPDADKSIDQPSGKSAGEALSLGSEFHAVNNCLPTPGNTTEQLESEPAASSIIFFTDEKDSSFLEDVSPVRAEPNAAEQALENNVQPCVRVRIEDSSEVNASSIPIGDETLETPAVPVNDENPFRLIEGYASDDSDEDDRRDGTEGSPAAAVESRPELQTDSSHLSPSTKSKEASIGRLPDKANLLSIDPSNEVVDLPDDDKWNDKTTKHKPSQSVALLDGDYMYTNRQVEKHHLKENANPDLAKVDVDEFGRIVRKGESDSDSDEVYLGERRVKRGRSRSWSRSPQENRRRRRSRSPRRREKRSRSHSWSPRRTRSKSPPADRQMYAISRRDRDQPRECLDYNRGRCFRGASCRFIHRDSTRHVGKRKQYHDIPRDSGKQGNHDVAPSSELNETAMTEMDIEECNEVPQEDSRSVGTQSHREKSGDTAKNDVGEVQVSNQISQDAVKDENSDAEEALEESKSTKPTLNSSQFLQAYSTLVESASPGSNNISQPQDVAQLPKEGSVSHHPLPYLHVGQVNQTHASQSPVHSHTNLVTSNFSQSFPRKDSSPAKVSGPDVNCQPSQQGPPGPPPLHHFPSDNKNAPFTSQHPTSFQSQPLPLPPNIFPLHRPPVVSDYHSQNILPNPGWHGMPPPPPTSYAMPPRHDFLPQAFQSVEPSLQPPFRMDELGRRPLPLGNHHDHPLARDDRFLHPPMPDGPQIILDSQRGYHLQNPSFSHVETKIPFPGQGFASSSSFVHGNTIHPQHLPRESLPNILHSFPGEHMGVRPISQEDVSSAGIKDVPYSHNPPPYGQQQNVNSSYPLNLPGSMDPSMQRYPSSFLDNRPPHYNPFASTFEQVPAGTKDASRFNSSHVPIGGPGGQILPRAGRTSLYLQENVDVVSGSQKLGVGNPVYGDSYDPLLDSIEPSSNMPKQFGHIGEPSLAPSDAGAISKLSNAHNPADVEENDKQKGIASTEHKPEVVDFGEGATDAEVGAVDNASPQPVDEKDWSPDLPIDIGNAVAGEIEVDQVRSPGKNKKSKDSRSMKLFKSALADFVKEVLKPSWRQGNMSKEAFKTIVKKTVEKVSGGMLAHHIPKSQVKINQYIESSQRKLTKLVMGYVDKYVKM